MLIEHPAHLWDYPMNDCLHFLAALKFQGTCGWFWPVPCEQEVAPVCYLSGMMQSRPSLCFCHLLLPPMQQLWKSCIPAGAATSGQTGTTCIRLCISRNGSLAVLSHQDFRVGLFLWDNMAYSEYSHVWPPFPSLSQTPRWHELYLEFLFHVINSMNIPIGQIKDLMRHFQSSQIPIAAIKTYYLWKYSGQW